ncbi:hypothetical protein JST97_32240 [bacterium]|nr:hypothetical protein [bacterium]
MLSLILSVAADLMRRARNVSSFYQQKSELQRAAWALQHLSLEVLSATRVVQPTLDGDSDHLEWVRIKQGVSGRLPTSLGSDPQPLPPPSPVWQPDRAVWTDTMSVYRLDTGDLFRWGRSSEVLLAQQLTDFHCHSQGHFLELSARVQVRGAEQQVKVFQQLPPGVQW